MAPSNRVKRVLSLPDERSFARAVGILVIAAGLALLIWTTYTECSDAEQLDKVALTSFLLVGVFLVVVGAGVSIPAAQIFLERLFGVLVGALGLKRGVLSQAPRDTPQPSKPSAPAQNLPHEHQLAPTFGALWLSAGEVRQPILDLVTPTYILNTSYQMLDWNPAFDELVAKPLKLRRGWHAGEFVRALKNAEDVVKRSQEVFGGAQLPLVDQEILEFPSEKHGLIRFQKLASQVSDEHGKQTAWCVHLNILDAGDGDALWADLAQRLEREVNWSKYARSYDNLLLNFDDYHELLEKIVKAVGDAKRCIDIGAGTGNGALQLLDRSGREVWAVDSNETMLQYMLKKARSRPGILERLVIVKEDVQRLDDLPESYFDGAIMINVLYAVEDPAMSLRQIHRLLQPGSRLVLSTSHKETDLDRLFEKIEDDLRRKGILDELRADLKQARDRHDAMDDQIHRHSREDVRALVEEAGYKIIKDYPDEYVGAVMIIVAEKR